MKKMFTTLILSFLPWIASAEYCYWPTQEYFLPRSVQIMEHLEFFGRDLADKYGMIFVDKGIGNLVQSDRTALDISLRGNCYFRIDYARLVVVAMMREFLDQATYDPFFTQYLRQCAKEIPGFDPSINVNRLGLSIFFSDPDNGFPFYPHIAQVEVVEGKIYYYFFNHATQYLGSPYIESLKEAMSYVGSRPGTCSGHDCPLPPIPESEYLNECWQSGNPHLVIHQEMIGTPTDPELTERVQIRPIP